MKSLIAFVKHRPVGTFFVLAYALSWAADLALPDLPVFPTGPFVAALIVLALTEGWRGVTDLLHRAVRWRVAPRWYAVTLGLPAVVVTLGVGLNILLGAPAPSADQLARWSTLFVPFIMRFVFIGLGEEPGWRGYALPRLQAGRSALAASLLLGVVWAGWHIPLFIRDDGFTLAAWAPKILSTVLASVVCAWMYNNTNGSVWLTALFHASYSTFGNQFFFKMFTGADAVRQGWLDVAVWAVAVVGVVIFAGPARLSRGPAAQPERLPKALPGV
jgi:uncharacterized protein